MLAPIPLYQVQPIVPVAGNGCIGRTLPRPTNDAHGQCVGGVHRQGQVAFGQGLVRNLAPGFWVAAPMTGIENFLAKILRVLIAASQHNGVSPCAAASGDTRYQWPVHPSLGEFYARGETTPFRITGNMPKGACDVHGYAFQRMDFPCIVPYLVAQGKPMAKRQGKGVKP